MSDEPVVKKPISERQRLANIANAQKSTGPRTDAGKNVSRFNGLVHGLRSELDVLPGESQEEYDARMAAWSQKWDVEDDLGRYYLTRAVRSSWFVERGEAAAEAIARKAMNAALRTAQKREAEELDRLLTQLAESPAATMRQIRETPSGCRWAREQWLIFAARLVKFKGLLATQRVLALNLLGKRMHDVYRDDPVVTRWAIAFLGVLYGDKSEIDDESIVRGLGGAPAGISVRELEIRVGLLRGSIPTSDQAHALLKRYVAEALAELDAHTEFIDELTEEDRVLDMTIARIDTAGAGKQLLNYVVAYGRSRDTAIQQLEKIKNPPPPRPGRSPGPERTTSPATADSKAATSDQPPTVTTEPPAAIATEAPSAVGTTASIDLEPPVGTIAELPPMAESPTTLESEVEPENTTEPISTAEPVLVLQPVRNTTEPISTSEASVEPGPDGNTTEPIFTVEPSAGPGPQRNTTEPIFTAEEVGDLVHRSEIQGIPRAGPVLEPGGGPLPVGLLPDPGSGRVLIGAPPGAR